MNHDELVEKMRQAWCDAEPLASGSQEQYWTHRMSAALSVAVEELLPQPEDDPELDSDLDAVTRTWNWDAPMDLSKSRVKTFIRDACCIYRQRLASRRSRYLKPKSAEERVEVRRIREDYTQVWLDGRFYQCFVEPKVAETYALGLIQQLKKQSK